MGSERRERGRIMGALNCGSIYGTYIVLTSNANGRHMPNKYAQLFVFLFFYNYTRRYSRYKCFDLIIEAYYELFSLSSKSAIAITRNWK